MRRLLGAWLVLAACGRGPAGPGDRAATAPAEPAAPEAADPSPPSGGAGASPAEDEAAVLGVTVRRLTWGSTDDPWVAVRLDLRLVSLDLVGQGDGAPTGLAEAARAMRTAGREPWVMMNAGMFREDRSPVGLHVQRGVTHRGLTTCRPDAAGNFCLLPNGVFWVDAVGGHVAGSDAVPANLAPVRLATQSGPALLLDGVVHPRFDPASTNRNLRNAVGVDRADASVVWFAMSEVPVRLYDSATLFRDALGCDDALYLDGAVSRLVAPGVRIGFGEDRYSGVLVAHGSAGPSAPPAR